MRAPLTAEPPEQPAQPDACDNDAMWELLMVRSPPGGREAGFAKVAGVGEYGKRRDRSPVALIFRKSCPPLVATNFKRAAEHE